MYSVGLDRKSTKIHISLDIMLEIRYAHFTYRKKFSCSLVQEFMHNFKKTIKPDCELFHELMFNFLVKNYFITGVMSET